MVRAPSVFLDAEATGSGATAGRGPGVLALRAAIRVLTSPTALSTALPDSVTAVLVMRFATPLIVPSV